MSRSIAAGDPAPDFAMPYTGSEITQLSSYAGRYLVLFFYPRDDTPVCRKEALDFSSLADKFKERGADILGLSRESVESHARFRESAGITVDLASDESGAVCEAYGVWTEKKLYGRSFMGIERSTFLIGPDGRIVRIWRRVRTPGHAEAVLHAIPAA